MVSRTQVHKLLTLLLIFVFALNPATGAAKSRKKKVSLPAPFGGRYLKIDGKEYMAHEKYARDGRLRYSVLAGPNYYKILVDKDLDGSADIWEEKRGKQMLVASLPVQGKFTRIEFTEYMPNAREKSLFIYQPMKNSYYLAKTRNEPYEVLNLDPALMGQGPAPTISLEPPATLSVEPSQTLQLELPQTTPVDPKCDPTNPQPPVDLASDSGAALEVLDQQVQRQLECFIKVMKPLLFDKTCLDNAEFKNSVSDMLKGFMLVVGSSKNIEVLNGNAGNNQYLGCMSALKLPYETADTERVINQKFAAVKASADALLSNADREVLGQTLMSAECELPAAISTKLQRPLTSGKRLFTCVKSNTSALASWAETNGDGQVTIRKKSSDVAKAMNMSADRAYASIILHELIHGGGVNDETYCQNIERCCSPGDDGQIQRDSTSCKAAISESTRIKEYAIVTQTLMSGFFEGDQNTVYNNLIVDLGNSNRAATVMDAWTNEIASHREQDFEGARSLAACNPDPRSPECNRAQTEYLERRWQEHTNNFFASGKCTGFMTGWGKPASLCDKYKTQFASLVTVRGENSVAFYGYMQQADHVRRDSIEVANSWDRADVLAFGPVSAPTLTLPYLEREPEKSLSAAPGSAPSTVNGQYAEGPSQPATTNPTISIPAQGNRPERAVNAGSLNTAAVSPVRMVPLSQTGSTRSAEVASLGASDSMFRSLTNAADSARNLILPSANATSRGDSSTRARSSVSGLSRSSPSLSKVSLPTTSITLGNAPTIPTSQQVSSSTSSSAAQTPQTAAATATARQNVAGVGTRNEGSSRGFVGGGGGSARVGGLSAQNSSKASRPKREPQGLKITSIPDAENILFGNYFNVIKYLAMTNFRTSLLDLKLQVEDKQNRIYGCRDNCKRVYKYCPKTEKLVREGGC